VHDYSRQPFDDLSAGRDIGAAGNIGHDRSPIN
jgi:hypothetical protein